MARKGNKKVKTGCFTCKIRKIKCDEAKPYCVKCSSTGRKCDGYPYPTQCHNAAITATAIATTNPQRSPYPPSNTNTSSFASIPTLATLPTTLPTASPSSAMVFPPPVPESSSHPPPPARYVLPSSHPETSPPDQRAMNFFRMVAGPALAGIFEADFWTVVVPQLGRKEAAVWNAVISVSGLFEHFHREPGLEKTMAIRKYNLAIRQLSVVSDPQVVLVTCVLFVCIEFLMGNKDMAIAHCRHGVLILNSLYAEGADPTSDSTPHLRSGPGSAWVHHNLLPLLRSLSIVPFFFGGTVNTFPAISPSLSMPEIDGSGEGFESVVEARLCLDAIMMIIVRLVRRTDEYRLGARKSEVIPKIMFQIQADIVVRLDRWARGAMRLDDEKGGKALAVLRMRYHVAHVWVLGTLSRSELFYDSFAASFRAVVDIAKGVRSKLLASPARTQTLGKPSGSGPDPTSNRQHSFVFEMGFIPPLYFVVIKCRLLSVRVAALGLLKELGTEREGLWDVRTMWNIGKYMVMFEHGISSLPSVADRIDPASTLASKPHARSRLESGGDVVLGVGGEEVVADRDSHAEVEVEDTVNGKRLWEGMVLGETQIRKDPVYGEVLFRKVRFVFGTAPEDLEVKDDWVRIG